MKTNEEHEHDSSLNVKNNLHWNKLQWPVSAVFYLSIFLKLNLNSIETETSKNWNQFTVTENLYNHSHKKRKDSLETRVALI